MDGQDPGPTARAVETPDGDANAVRAGGAGASATTSDALPVLLLKAVAPVTVPARFGVTTSQFRKERIAASMTTQLTSPEVVQEWWMSVASKSGN